MYIIAFVELDPPHTFPLGKANDGLITVLSVLTVPFIFCACVRYPQSHPEVPQS